MHHIHPILRGFEGLDQNPEIQSVHCRVSIFSVFGPPVSSHHSKFYVLLATQQAAKWPPWHGFGTASSCGMVILAILLLCFGTTSCTEWHPLISGNKMATLPTLLLLFGTASGNGVASLVEVIGAEEVRPLVRAAWVLHHV